MLAASVSVLLSVHLILFLEIDGFNDLARTCTPLDLFEMLDLIYKTFDARMDKYDVFKARRPFCHKIF